MSNNRILLALLFISTAGFSARGQQPGANLWSFQTGNAIQSTPALGMDGSLYFGSLDGNLYGLNANGKLKWSFAIGSFIQSSPVVGPEGAICVGALDNKLYSISQTGTQNWAFKTEGWIISSPALATDGTLYVGSWDHRLYAIHPQGTLKWTLATEGEIYASPAVGMDGTVYIGSRDHKVYAVDAAGHLKWTFATQGPIDSSIAIGAGEMILVGAGDGTLYALDHNGVPGWTFSAGAGINSSPAVGADGTIYFMSMAGILYGLNSDGSLRWSLATSPGPTYSSPAVGADRIIYCGAPDGTLYALNANGAKQWSIGLGGALKYSSPLLSPEGVLYLGSEDGRLYAIKASAGLANTPWPMFRRDPHHSASGFVARHLPDFYSPGGKLIVRLVTTPASAVSGYWVEEQFPAGWTVASISHGGNYLAAAGKIRFGPYYDAAPRMLTYELTPPVKETGTKLWAGIASADGLESYVGGDIRVPFYLLHPADNKPVDAYLSLAEITAYGAAWKTQTAWATGPDPIPATFLSRAVALWLGGGFYYYDNKNPLAPYYWTNVNTVTNATPADLAALNAVASNTMVVASQPPSFELGKPIPVQIAITPSAPTRVYAVEEQPAPGWVVSDLSDLGRWDPVNQRIKWGPFFDALPRQLTYTALPTTNTPARAVFTGVAAFDGAVMAITGQRQTELATNIVPVARRILPHAYSPGTSLTITLEVAPPLSPAQYYIIENLPPGWIVKMTSQGGYLQEVANRIIFGPYFDGLPRILTYQLTPPAQETGERLFSGTITLDGVDNVIGGDDSLAFAPLHPADRNPVDHHISLVELTEYGAAWKTNPDWITGPNPIPIAYLNQALYLWQQGEAYRFDAASGEAPNYWITSELPATELSISSSAPSAANSLAVASMSDSFIPGQELPVSLQVTPAPGTVNYVIEELIPQGWGVAGINQAGRLDEKNRKIKWGPFFDDTPRTVTYQARPGVNSPDPTLFQGWVALDGALLKMNGQRLTTIGGLRAPPRLSIVRYSATTGLELALMGKPTQQYQIQASTNLFDWILLQTLTNTGTASPILDPLATNDLQRFYRAVLP